LECVILKAGHLFLYMATNETFTKPQLEEFDEPKRTTTRRKP